MPDEEALDLPAAAVRADAAELEMSIELLAVRLEHALGQMVSVERHRAGGFRSKRTEVQRILVALGEVQFELVRGAAQQARCTRQKVVRGITLSRQELDLADWIGEVIAGVSHRAQIGERDRAALQDLLG